jgi:hypothetical protein
MGTVLRLPGLTINNPAAPIALTEAFGVSGLSHRYEADSFAAVASGTAVTPPWPDKATGGGTTVSSGTTKKGPLLQAYGSLDKFDSLEWSTAVGDVGVDSYPTGDNTVAIVFGYTGSGAAKVFDLLGRKMVVGTSTWVVQPNDGSSGTGVQYPFTSQPKPDANQMAVAVVTLPADTAATVGLTLRTAGVTSKASAVASIITSVPPRLRIGPGSQGGSGNSPQIAAFGIWPRLLTDSEITGTVVPALRTRFGMQ